MNTNTASSASSGTPHNVRKERGGIATQACDFCRSRKQKCDEIRPKCSVCQRLNLECIYKEPQPTKKDNTLLEILHHLKSLEGKIDRIPTYTTPPSDFGSSRISPASQPSVTPDIDRTSYSMKSVETSLQTNLSGMNHPYRHASAAHKILTWPAIQQTLLQAMPSSLSDLSNLEQEGLAFIIGIQKGMPTLSLNAVTLQPSSTGVQAQMTMAVNTTQTPFPGLTYDIMHRLATSYFNTFNLLYPFMDRQDFMSNILNKVYTEGFNDDTESVIALLVLALGEMAEEEGGKLFEEYRGHTSELNSEAMDRPPGIALFNEARKRLGFSLTEYELENVQIFSLTALYYESCSRHLEFWRLMVSASSACQVLITCNPIDWNTPRGDVIKRMYWHCAIVETGLHLELDLPLTGIIELQDRVGLPIFDKSFDCEEDDRANSVSHYRQHFASQIALRRLCAEFHNSINKSMTLSNKLSTEESPSFSPAFLNSLAMQLEAWRELLPHNLQWSENDPTDIPLLDSIPQISEQLIDPSLSDVPLSAQGRFAANLDRQPMDLPFIYDIQVALLRTRYYYAKYTIYRPFVYKALHFPETIAQEDAEGVASCLKSCLKWPLLLAPTSRHKRMIPYLFCWSQNFLGILLILHMSTRENTVLYHIRTQFCGEDFEIEAAQSTSMMIDWIRDLSTSDPIAAWCYTMLQAVYSVD